MNSESSFTLHASLGRRFLAYLLDGLILIIPMAIANHMLPVLGGLALWFLYAPILEASSIRATLGKYLVGIQVTDLNGGSISFRAALIRNFLKLISMLIVFLGFFVALFNSRKQTLHDLLAETIVVYGRSEQPIGEAWLSAMRAVFHSNPIDGSPSGVTSATSESKISQLERLQNLRDKGALTEEEFLEQKKKILEQP